MWGSKMLFWKPEIDELIDVDVDDEQWWELIEHNWLCLDNDKPPSEQPFDQRHPFAGVWIFVGICIIAIVIGWICQNIFHLW